MTGILDEERLHGSNRTNPVAVALVLSVTLATGIGHAQHPTAASTVRPLPQVPGANARSIVFILADDHRYDAGFMGHPVVKTPSMDRMARHGVHLRNAFVTTALCSPSRTTILTGLYAHQHKVVDDNSPVPPGTTYFPQYLQQAGYQTAFVGKWHMGEDDGGPQPGFDRWVSFRGQGSYLPAPDGLNVDGKKVPQKGYVSDELTDYALDWLEMNNLAYSPEFAATAKRMSDRLFAILEETGGRFIPLYPDRFHLFNKRTPVAGAEQAAPFPPALILKPGEKPC